MILAITDVHIHVFKYYNMNLLLFKLYIFSKFYDIDFELRFL